jgi:RNA polymerase sigma-70 factor (ECF subfamily)
MPVESLKELFQQEFAKMVAVISNLFGLQHMETAEDIVSDTFLTAAEEWETKGMPPNPTAWLYTVAKRKTIHHFRRRNIYEHKVIPAIRVTAGQEDDPTAFDIDFSPQHIRDSQLQMLFAICTPAIVSEAQIGLALRILCGFGIDEIAEAFLTNKETVNKRLFRAKEKLRGADIRLEMPAAGEIPARLDNVLHIIYLLFSEGYYSQAADRVFQKELCWEAIRLGILLTDYEGTNQPKTNALLALMCFHASRFNARQSGEDDVILYDQQDERLWDTDLIRRGMQYLTLSATGDQLSSYHLEARIASWHCIKEDTPEKWEEILQLYNQLLMVNYSPGVALNRTFALYKANGREQALIELEKLKLDGNHFYNVLRDYLRKLPPH